MILVNVVVVVALWVSYRSARTLPRRFFVPLGTTAVAGALVLALLSWSVVTLNRVYPPLEVLGVLDRDGAGNYIMRDLGAR